MLCELALMKLTDHIVEIRGHEINQSTRMVFARPVRGRLLVRFWQPLGH
jgi:hypothetical protein